MDLFCGFKVFILFITCLFKQKIATDNYSPLHRRFFGEHGKPTLGGCGWRQGSLTLSFARHFFYDWPYDYDCHVPFSYVSPSDHPLQYYKNGLSQTCERYILDSPSLSISRFFWGNLRFQMVSHRKISQPDWIISQNCFSQQIDGRHKNWLCQF
jgi:hypothetical protein